MAERKRSKDGRSETAEILGARGAIQAGGRSGGGLARDIASRDELKRAFARPAGATRVSKSDKKDKGDA